MKTRIRQLTEQEKRSLGESQMITDWLKIFPKGILSIVSDTFDLWKLITEYLPANKEAIMARDGKLVIRPDSGDPVDIICGIDIDSFNNIKEAEDYFRAYGIKHLNVFKVNNICYKIVQHSGNDFKYEPYKGTPESKGVIELLWDIFGGTVNEQGYKVLDPHIGAIYGDSITPERQVQIYERLEAKGFAATNIVLGVGSFTYQYNTRDTLGFAAKGAWFEVEECGECAQCECESNKECIRPIKKSYNIYKDPVTDDGTKKSLKGLLQVVKGLGSGEYIVKQECTPEEESLGLLQVIYEDGKFYNTTTFKEIRNRLKEQ